MDLQQGLNVIMCLLLPYKQLQAASLFLIQYLTLLIFISSKLQQE